VLVATAFLDEALGIAIRRNLKRASGLTDKELDPLLHHKGQRPLGSFYGRIEAARALGIIEKPQWSLLNYLRDLRNDCAHFHAKAGLSEKNLRDMLAMFGGRAATFTELADDFKKLFRENRKAWIRRLGRSVYERAIDDKLPATRLLFVCVAGALWLAIAAADVSKKRRGRSTRHRSRNRSDQPSFQGQLAPHGSDGRRQALGPIARPNLRREFMSQERTDNLVRR
jgi:hypothetical protein